MSNFCPEVSIRKGKAYLVQRRTLVVVNDVSQVVTTAVMRFAHAHRVVCEVDIAVIAWGLSVEA
jgi:hypothetical protein